jgi:hypothetical protein
MKIYGCDKIRSKEKSGHGDANRGGRPSFALRSTRWPVAEGEAAIQGKKGRVKKKQQGGGRIFKNSTTAESYVVRACLSRDDSGQSTSAINLHPQSTSAIDNFGY